jgi:hypothetical protein
MSKRGSALTVTVITPCFPTFSIALAIISPISRSPFAEIVATYSDLWDTLADKQRQNKSSVHRVESKIL